MIDAAKLRSATLHGGPADGRIVSVMDGQRAVVVKEIRGLEWSDPEIRDQLSPSWWLMNPPRTFTYLEEVMGSGRFEFQ